MECSGEVVGTVTGEKERWAAWVPVIVTRGMANPGNGKPVLSDQVPEMSLWTFGNDC